MFTQFHVVVMFHVVLRNDTNKNYETLRLGHVPRYS